MVSVCLPSDALLQHLVSYLGFSFLGRGVSLHGCSSKAQPLLLILDEGYLLIAALPDLQHGIAPLGPPAPVQPRLLGRGVGPPSHRPWPRTRCNSSHRRPWTRTLGISSQPPPQPWTRGSSSRPFLHHHSLVLSDAAPDLGCGATALITAPDLGRGVAPLSRSCAVAAWHSRPPPLTSDAGQLLLAAALRAWGPPSFCPWPRTWLLSHILNVWKQNLTRSSLSEGLSIVFLYGMCLSSLWLLKFIHQWKYSTSYDLFLLVLFPQ